MFSSNRGRSIIIVEFLYSDGIDQFQSLYAVVSAEGDSGGKRLCDGVCLDRNYAKDARGAMRPASFPWERVNDDWIGVLYE